jgi:hypothetical protein
MQTRRQNSWRKPGTENKRIVKRNSHVQDPNWKIRKAFPGQPTYSSKVMSNPTKLTTTVTTGLIAVAPPISTSNVASFSTRFAGFEECRIIKAVLKITCFSSINPGRIMVYVDEDDNTVPTIALAQSHRCLQFAAGNVNRIFKLVYENHDVANLVWTSVSAGIASFANFKIFTDNANLGATIVATDYLDYSIEYTFQFRGFSV